ncbi:sulfurtransferase [Endozoicomonas sp. SCSIO W0465]|uniref:sulfurtransferase n=1 Tax=Endozoicomonas sp. SCSIO W0465 TaxID=2918516 RepID=UPI0020755573|nr:sulfurtransferase [Endozoicomonas sp. SCSIO W0465]USE34682.1 sulfurtransferase [Endozoicomonas sp. SCSIO W0465]
MPLLIEPEMLATLLKDQCLVVLDTRFSLADPEQGRVMYNQGHIPGALYADLEADLSGLIIPGQTGRHPLPDQADWQATLRRWGIDKHTRVVVYDDGGHAMAARAWWLLRWAGISQAMILHGGMKAWLAGRYPVTIDVSEMTESQGDFTMGHMPTVSALDLMAQIETEAGRPGHKLIDARAYERFRGEEETMDSQAGHIPGAVCHPFVDNLDEEGRFLSVNRLREIFSSLVGDDSRPVFYCGSGVTACHNIFAMELAGLSGATLYPGSWSEWITDSRRPVARG